MSDEELKLNPPPVPALPLEYFDRRGGPWVAVVRLMAWVGIIYAGLVIASELTSIIAYLLQSFSRTSYRVNLSYNIVPGILPSLNAILMLIGGSMALQGNRSGRQLLLGSCIGAVACAMLGIFITLLLMPLSIYPTFRLLPILFQQIVGGFFTALQHSIVPMLLWIVFRKREVREVFDAS